MRVKLPHFYIGGTGYAYTNGSTESTTFALATEAPMAAAGSIA